MRQQLEYCHVRRSGWIELKVGLIYVRNETDIECWYSKIELYDMILIRWAVKESHMAFTFYDRLDLPAVFVFNYLYYYYYYYVLFTFTNLDAHEGVSTV